jgi:hypothetical protein
MWHVPQLFAYNGMGSTCESQFCSLHAQGKQQTLLARMVSDMGVYHPPFWESSAVDLAGALAEAKVQSPSRSVDQVELLQELESLKAPMKTAFQMLFRPSPPLECALHVYVRRHFFASHEQDGVTDEATSALSLTRLVNERMKDTTCIQIRTGGGMGSGNTDLDPVRHKPSTLHLFASSAEHLMRRREQTCSANDCVGSGGGGGGSGSCGGGGDTSCDSNCDEGRGNSGEDRRWLVVTDDPAAAARMREFGHAADGGSVNVMTTVNGSRSGVVHISRTDAETAKQGLLHVYLDWLLLTRCESSRFVASRSGFSLTAAALMRTSTAAHGFASCCIISDRDLKPLKVAMPSGMVMHNVSVARADDGVNGANDWLVPDGACKEIFVGM